MNTCFFWIPNSFKSLFNWCCWLCLAKLIVPFEALDGPRKEAETWVSGEAERLELQHLCRHKEGMATQWHPQIEIKIDIEMTGVLVVEKITLICFFGFIWHDINMLPFEKDLWCLVELLTILASRSVLAQSQVRKSQANLGSLEDEHKAPSSRRWQLLQSRCVLHGCFIIATWVCSVEISWYHRVLEEGANRIR